MQSLIAVLDIVGVPIAILLAIGVAAMFLRKRRR
jgi:hypothetical protein